MSPIICRSLGYFTVVSCIKNTTYVIGAQCSFSVDKLYMPILMIFKINRPVILDNFSGCKFDQYTHCKFYQFYAV